MAGTKVAWRCARGHVHADWQAALACGPEPLQLSHPGVRCKSGHLHMTQKLAEECELARLWARAKELGLTPHPAPRLEAAPRGDQLELF